MQSLSISDRVEFLLVLDDLLVDPHPDGISKVSLDFFPYESGTIGFSGGEFWITYKFLNAAMVGIASVYWRPDSPRRAGELYEILYEC